MVFLMFSWIELTNETIARQARALSTLMGEFTNLSLVHMILVPIFTPDAPRASAAANWLPFAIPPDARKGTFNFLAARACCISSLQYPACSKK